MHASYVIKKPIVTEKSTMATGEANQYVFLVDRRATKDDIKDAVETLYGVRPIGVTTQMRKGGRRRLKYGWIEPAPSKKATVRLAEGKTIEVI
jgi:large subunit ribosomal protein L23